MELFDAAFLKELSALHDALLRLRGRAGEGVARAGRAAGQSEFRGHRPYAQGDDLRRLDWNAYGRLGKMYVREFERERHEHVTVLLDCSRSMAAGTPPKHVFARHVAAAVGFLALKAEGSAALFPGVSLEGSTRVNKWLELLRAAEPTEAGTLESRIKAVAEQKRPPTDLVVISDFLEDLKAIEPLENLSERRCNVTLVQVLSPDEISPALLGGVDLASLEESEELRLTLDASSLAAYRAQLEAHLEAIEAFASRHGWTYALAPSDSSLRALFTGKLAAVGGAA
ncbi:hypothetical protein BAC2_03360 [uncultured bacterium]|nr:hypothetical protein BAC2_03360 [uncultured bacterium]